MLLTTYVSRLLAESSCLYNGHTNQGRLKTTVLTRGKAMPDPIELEQKLIVVDL